MKLEVVVYGFTDAAACQICDVFVVGAHRHHDQGWIAGEESIFCIAETRY